MNSEFPSSEDYAAESARFGAREVVDILALQGEVVEHYKNQVLLDINGDCLRMSVFEGDYRWHFHPDTDELFLVVTGRLHIEFEDGQESVLGPWQGLVVPTGTVHRTRAVGRTVNVTVEKKGATTVFVGSPSSSSSKPIPLRGTI